MRSRDKKLFAIIFGVILLVALMLSIGLMSTNRIVANAYDEDDYKIFSVEQSSELVYFGENYLKNSDTRERFIQAFTFKLDNNIVVPNDENTIISCAKQIISPGIYKCDFTIKNGEKYYSLEDVKVTVSKKNVAVTVLLNGKTDLTVSEGEIIHIYYDYEGAISKDEKIEFIDGVKVISIKDEMLTRKAYVEYLPKDSVTNYYISANHAQSDYYDFFYNKSKLNIVKEVALELNVEGENGTLVSLFGNFSSINEIDFEDLGSNDANNKFAEIKGKIYNLYSNSGELLTENEIIASYSVDVTKFGKVANGNVPATVSIALKDNLLNKNSYKVIALYNNGETEVLDAKINDNFIVFSASDMGDFVVLSQVKGVSTTSYIIAISIGVLVVLIIIFLVALFRKKY